MCPYGTWWAPYIKSGCKMKMALFIIVTSISWLGEQDKQVIVLCYVRRTTISHSIHQGMEVKTVSKNFPICQSFWCCVKLLTRGLHGKCHVQVLASYCVLGYKWTWLHSHLSNAPCNLCSHFDIFCSFFSHSCLQTRALRKCFFSQMVEGRKGRLICGEYISWMSTRICCRCNLLFKLFFGAFMPFYFWLDSRAATGKHWVERGEQDRQRTWRHESNSGRHECSCALCRLTNHEAQTDAIFWRDWELNLIQHWQCMGIL